MSIEFIALTLANKEKSKWLVKTSDIKEVIDSAGQTMVRTETGTNHVLETFSQIQDMIGDISVILE